MKNKYSLKITFKNKNIKNKNIKNKILKILNILVNIFISFNLNLCNHLSSHNS